MPYLPARPTAPTTIPNPYGADLDTTIRLIEAMWEDHYSLLGYLPLDKRTTPVADVNTLSGEAGATKFDPLWGEPVDPAQTEWKQAQGTNGVVAAANVEVYRPEVQLRFQINHVTAESPDLKKYGFDDDDRRVGTIVATAPVSLFDAVGVTAQAGDLVLWEGDQWYVVRPRLSGYWSNTNVRLYVNLLCERRRQGS